MKDRAIRNSFENLYEENNINNFVLNMITNSYIYHTLTKIKWNEDEIDKCVNEVCNIMKQTKKIIKKRKDTKIIIERNSFLEYILEDKTPYENINKTGNLGEAENFCVIFFGMEFSKETTADLQFKKGNKFEIKCIDKNKKNSNNQTAVIKIIANKKIEYRDKKIKKAKIYYAVNDKKRINKIHLDINDLEFLYIVREGNELKFMFRKAKNVEKYINEVKLPSKDGWKSLADWGGGGIRLTAKDFEQIPK